MVQHSNETSLAVLLHGAAYYAVQGSPQIFGL